MKSAVSIITICLVLAFSLSSIFWCAKADSCPCDDAKYCQRISNPKQKPEVFAFLARCNQTVWKQFPWDKLTTLVLPGWNNTDLLCMAHKNNVRVLRMSDIPKANLTSKEDRRRWIKAEILIVRSLFLDGINVDFEDDVGPNSPERDGLTALVQESQAMFSAALPNSVVTIDVSWSPSGIDGRWYDYVTISKFVDSMFVMDYDEQSQIFRPNCTAWANSPFFDTISGMARYLELGIPSSKLILGVPWYAYDYTCLSLQGDSCFIEKVHFKNVSCSDAVGRQIAYSEIVNDFLPRAISGVKWDVEALSPYFNYQDVGTNTTHQVWFDDPFSIQYKFKMATAMQLRGVGMWTANFLDYGNATMVQSMWGLMP